MTDPVDAPLLRRAVRVLPAGHWHGAVEAGTVTLAFDDRHRRRMRMTDDAGVDFLLDLQRAVALNDGDGLDLGDGTALRVVAAAEDLAEARCHGMEHFGRVAWHLGNRHLPVQVVGDAVRIRRDHVIQDMLRGLGAEVVAIHAPFQPESGAYAGQPGTAHGHEHSHGHAHAQSDAHSGGHAHSHGGGHTHSHSQSHTHVHSHTHRHD